MDKMTRDQAMAFYESKKWEMLSHRERAHLQMNETYLCMPFGVFHESLEHALGRPVFTHELGMAHEAILAELNGTGPAPSLADILNLVPAEKRIVVVATEAE